MNILVLAGGISTERDVSFATGKNVYEAIKKLGHKAIIIDPFMGYDGDIKGIFDAGTDWSKEIEAVKEGNPDINAVKAMRDPKYKGFFGPNVIKLCHEADVVFIALHGENGENGRIQAFFDLEGIIYTGTDTTSSAICLNKGIAKEIMAYNGISTPKGIHIYKGNDTSNTIGYPCVVKSCCGGSSVGVTIVNDEKGYQKALDEGFRYDNEVIIEEYVKGREFSVGVLEGKALPVIEIIPKTGFYDYKNKYQAGATVEICPAQIDENKTKEMQMYAERAFKALRLRDYARMDFMMSQESGKLYCLEANTLPGMTVTSLIPQEAAAAGIGFEELIEKLINMAVARKNSQC